MDISFLLVWGGIVLYILWRGWFSRLMFPGFASAHPSVRFSLLILPMMCAVFLLFVLLKYSSATVRSDRLWVSGYFVFGAAWIVGLQFVFGFLGIGMRDDVIERRNASAAWVVAGQLLASTFCFAGANIGNGQGPEVVVFCVLLSTASLLLTWVLFDWISSVSETVTIERNLAAGIRASGWLTAVGIICGASVTGDWSGTLRTLNDVVRYAWPMAIFSLGMALFERALRKRPAMAAQFSVRASAAIAIGSVALAVAYVCNRGIR